MNIRELLNWGYLTTYPPVKFSYTNIVLFILISCTLACIPLIMYTSKRFMKTYLYRKIVGWIGWTLIVVDIFGWLAYVSRVQSLPIFSYRLVFLLWAIFLLIEAILILLYFLFRFRKAQKQFKQKVIKEKYLPKRKG